MDVLLNWQFPLSRAAHLSIIPLEKSSLKTHLFEDILVNYEQICTGKGLQSLVLYNTIRSEFELDSLTLLFVHMCRSELLPL